MIRQANAPMTDLRVLAALADGLGKPLGIRTAKQALAEIVELGTWDAPATKAEGDPQGRCEEGAKAPKADRR